MALDLIVILISVTVIGGLGFALRCDWGARMGKDLGRRHMKEIGMEDDQDEYHE